MHIIHFGHVKPHCPAYSSTSLCFSSVFCTLSPSERFNILLQISLGSSADYDLHPPSGSAAEHGTQSLGHVLHSATVLVPGQ